MHVGLCLPAQPGNVPPTRSLHEQEIPPRPLSVSHELTSRKTNSLPNAALNASLSTRQNQWQSHSSLPPLCVPNPHAACCCEDYGSNLRRGKGYGLLRRRYQHTESPITDNTHDAGSGTAAAEDERRATRKPMSEGESAGRPSTPRADDDK